MEKSEFDKNCMEAARRAKLPLVIKKVCLSCDRKGRCKTEKNKGDKDDTCLGFVPEWNRFKQIRKIN